MLRIRHVAGVFSPLPVAPATPATVAAAVGDKPDPNASQNCSRTESGNRCQPCSRKPVGYSIKQHPSNKPGVAATT
jgi:hypothetical protein